MKRCVGFVLLLCFGVFSLEALIADVHDGDAGEMAIRNVGERGEEPASPAPVSSREQGATAVDDTAGTPATPSPESRSEQHRHACHCMHAHGGWTAAPIGFPPPPAAARLAIIDVVLTPPAVDPATHLRPPIA